MAIGSVNLDGRVGADCFLIPAFEGFGVFGGSFFFELLFDLDMGEEERFGEGRDEGVFLPNEFVEAFAGEMPGTSVNVDCKRASGFFGEGGCFDEIGRACGFSEGERGEDKQK